MSEQGMDDVLTRVRILDSYCPDCGRQGDAPHRPPGPSDIPGIPIREVEDAEAYRRPIICRVCGGRMLVSTEPVCE